MKIFRKIPYFDMIGAYFLIYIKKKYTDSESESGQSADFKNRRILGTKNTWKILLY